MATSPPRSHRNNFDLIRLAAAGQVAVVHAVEHLGLRLPFHDMTLAVLDCFPGVPIFFIISGFLIAPSFERQSLGDFARNRALRILPGLWACLALSLASVWAAGYFIDNPPPAAPFAAWFLAQATFAQFFNPDFLRGYGIGVLNGSLWTITVEMQFYALTPFIVLLFRRSVGFFWSTLAALAIVNTAQLYLDNSMAGKLISVTFGPWLYMFMLGAALHFLGPRVRRWCEGRFLLWAMAYAVIVAVDVTFGVGASGNNILFPYVFVLSGLVISAAYTKPDLAHTVLRKNDISYGLYVYHMPVYNFTLYTQLDWGWTAIAVAAVCAALSWKLIEKPALALKASQTAPAARVGVPLG